MCASPNSMLDLERPIFGVGKSFEAETNETAWIAGKWLGNYADNSTPCFTVIDTPGVVDDAQGRYNCMHRELIGEVVKNLSPIDAFVLIFKGTTSRFTKSFLDQLSFIPFICHFRSASTSWNPFES